MLSSAAKNWFTVDQLGFHLFTIEAWIDHFLTWHRDLKKRIDGKATEDELAVQLRIGLEHVRNAAARANARDKRKLQSFIETLESDDPVKEKIADLWSADLLELMWRNAERKFAVRYHSELQIEVDRPKARFSSWCLKRFQ